LKDPKPSSVNNKVDSDTIAISQSVDDELVAWSVKLNSGTANAKDKQDFDNWRAQNPAHEAAWQELYTLEQSFDALAGESKQVAASTLKFAEKQRNKLSNRRRTLKLLSLAAITIFSAAVLTNQYMPWQQEMHYATSIGKRDKFLLSDGTHLMLNTNTKVDVKFSLLKREIVLHDGEIYMDTGKDANSIIGRRQFWVKTNPVEFKAIGTQFSVSHHASSSKLHVVQGIVAMYAGHEPVLANANESYTLSSVLSEPVKMTDLNGELDMDPIAWVDGMLIVKQMRLDKFVAELSRYQTFSLRCDPKVAGFKVSGVFQLNRTDPVEHALNAVARTLPIRIIKQGTTIHISGK
jgi:transmembrane sensor